MAKGCLYTYKERSFENVASLRSFIKADLALQDSKKDEFYTFGDTVEDSESYTQSAEFGKNITEEANSYKEIPTTLIDNEGNISENYAFTELKNTILVGSKNTVFDVNQRLLNNLDNDVWNSNQKEVVSVIKDLEKELVKSNIDIIGLSELSASREIVTEVLDKVESVLKDPSNENLSTLSEVLNEYFPKEIRSYVKELPQKYANYNIQEIQSDLTKNELFLQHGLIKVQDNLYHKVEIESLDIMYEGIYNKYLDNELTIPNHYFEGIEDVADIDSKAEVLNKIKLYVESRDVGFETEAKEQVSAVQVYYNHTPIEQRRIEELLETDSNYLKNDFVPEFYNYILTEKLKNSNIYNQTLKNFRVTDGDLSYHGVELEVKGIEMELELRDYVKIKKDLGKLKELLVEPVYLNEDINILNNPRKVRQEPAYTKIEEGTFVTENSDATYIKTGNSLSRLIFQTPTHNIYKEVNTVDDGVYYNNNLEFDANIQQELKIYNKWVETNYNPFGESAVTVEMEQLTKKDKDKYDNCE